MVPTLGGYSISRTNLVAGFVFLLLAVGFALFFHYRIEHKGICPGHPRILSPRSCLMRSH